MEAALELQNDLKKLFDETDPTRKADLEKTFSTELLPKHVKVFESRLAKNGTGFLVGNSLTVADLFLFNLVDVLALSNAPRPISALANANHIRAHEDRIRNMPRIAEWIRKRPKTDK